jgi:phosphohistidine phosphatase
MKLYFFRHGRADWPDWTDPDDERPLTKKGRKEIRKVAKHLQKLVGKPLVLTSPLPRAKKTAEIAAGIWGAELREEATLQPGFRARQLEPFLPQATEDGLVLVGHEPDFTEAIAHLTGATTKLSKAGVALIELDAISRSGRLLWVAPPKLLLL